MRVLRGEQTTRETFKAQAQASATEQQQRAAAPRGFGAAAIRSSEQILRNLYD